MHDPVHVIYCNKRTARGKTWREVAPPGALHLPLPDGALPSPTPDAGVLANQPCKLTIELGSEARQFEPVLTEHRDFRNLLLWAAVVSAARGN